MAGSKISDLAAVTSTDDDNSVVAISHTADSGSSFTSKKMTITNLIANATGGEADTIKTVTRGTDATHYPTFVTDNNGSATGEAIYTDAGIAYNPSSNLLTVGEISATTLDIGGTNVTSSAAELNILDGVTSTAAELNILDGVTATTAELNILDGVTSTAAELNILDGVTATASEINTLDGVTSTAAEINTLDGVTAGTVSASKALVADSNKDITGLRNLTITGDLSVTGTTTTVDTVTMQASNAVVFEGASADDHESTLTIVDPTADRTIKLPNQSGCLPVLAADSATQITSTPEELNILDGVTSTAAELNILDGVTSTAAELNILDGVTSTAAELNLLDGVTSTTAELNILDGVTSTAAEINVLDGITATTAELNYTDGVTSAIQTQLNAKVATGANVNTLVANTSAVSAPSTYYFLVVDQSDGSIKVVDKNFIEVE